MINKVTKFHLNCTQLPSKLNQLPTKEGHKSPFPLKTCRLSWYGCEMHSSKLIVQCLKETPIIVLILLKSSPSWTILYTVHMVLLQTCSAVESLVTSCK